MISAGLSSGISRQSSHGLCGAVLAEFAVVTPVLVLLVFGLMQFGFVFAAHLTVRNAASVSARHLALGDPAQCAARASEAPTVAANAISTTLDPANIGAVNAQCNVNVNGTVAHRVDIVYNFPLLFSLVLPGSGATFAVKASAIMR